MPASLIAARLAVSLAAEPIVLGEVPGVEPEDDQEVSA